MRVAGIRETSLFDGIGINFVIFLQGCDHHCDGCQNPQTWDKNGGASITLQGMKKIIEPYIGFIDGITFSGGDPVLQIDEVLGLAYWAKSRDLSTTLYTGYTFDEIKGHIDLTPFDYIVDGRYEKSKHSLDTPFRGSYNQKMYRQYHHYDCGWQPILFYVKK